MLFRHVELTPKKLIGILFVAVALAISIYAVTQRTNFQPEASEGAVLYMTGAPETAHPGDTLKLSLDVTTDETPIQTVRVILTYPESKLTFQRIDTTSSPFDMGVENIHYNGYLQLAREASSPVNGKNHIATLYFQAKDTVTTADIQPVKGTSLLDMNNKNIYTDAVSREGDVSPTPEQRSVFSVQFFFELVKGLFDF